MGFIMEWLGQYPLITAVIVLGGCALYELYVLAPRRAISKLGELEGFQAATLLWPTEGLLAFDFGEQRIAVIKNNIARVLDVSEVRGGSSHYTSLSKDGVLTQKDFHVILSIINVNDPELKIYFRSSKDSARCIEAIQQMIEIRNSRYIDQDNIKIQEKSNSMSQIDRISVILTAIEAETRSVLSHFELEDEVSVVGTIFHKGTFIGHKGDWTVLVAEVGPRNVNAGLIAERAIQSFNPSVAFFIGIAGGIKDVKIGDVVAATKIYAYESGKETLSGFKPRPELRLTSHLLEQQARSVRLKGKWLEQIAG